MKANVSNRWMNEAVQLVKQHDFDLNRVHDNGGKCEFCGQTLKYVAVIEAETNGDITRNVGLNCLEHVLGRTWKHMARAKDQTEKLKAKARRERLKEKYDFEKHLSFLKYIEGTTYDNSFLSDMRHILITKERTYTKNMAEAVQKSLEEFKKEYHSGKTDKKIKTKAQRQAEFKPVLKRVRKLHEYVVRMERETDIASNSRYRKPASAFVKSVLDYAERKMKISKKQMEILETIYNRYQKYEQQMSEEG